MPNRNYEAGRRAEYRTMRHHERLGFTCSRNASSKGPWDVVAVSGAETRLIQVSCGDKRKSPTELEAFDLLKVAPQTTKLYMHWPKGAREPIVREI
jgi:hypothetical protein